MGAGCSTQNAIQVSDSVKPKNINQLNKEAQEQLKIIQLTGQIPGTPSKLKDMLKSSKSKFEDVSNMDRTQENVERLKHQDLWEAVEINDALKVKNYIEQYEEKNSEELKEAELYDHTGNSVIHKAASLGHAEILMLLLEMTGAKPDMPNSMQATPLHLACRNNRLDAARFLIGTGVDVNTQDEHGQVPLLICTIHGHYDLAKVIIDASVSGLLPEPIDIDLKDHRGLSPLNCAAIKGDFGMTKLLTINGNASVDQQSPKGCSPLLYAARGGYTEVVRFLVRKGASVLRQDNAGGTVLHHCIEKSHVQILNVLQEDGLDIYSAIEIPDNAGRTPIFEAVDNLENPDILLLLTRDRAHGGFGAKVNIMNYNGQTPLFSACREGNFEVVQALIEQCKAEVDLSGGELFKDDTDEPQQKFESLQEKFFMDAYKNCMTPLHVAAVLGYDHIVIYLIEQGANPNLQTKIKGYTTLHLAVLANKPEVIIELLTKTQANPYLPDFGGRTLQDMIEIYIPSYLESFKTLLDNLSYLKERGLQEDGDEQNIHALAEIKEEFNESDTPPIVARHYVNLEDERTLKGAGEDEGKIKELFNKKIEGEDGVQKPEGRHPLEDKQNALINFQFMNEEEIQTMPESRSDPEIEKVFGSKVAISMNALDWRFKEVALKVVYKFTEKQLDIQNTTQEIKLEELVSACTSVIGCTCKDKVIKVFMISLQLLNLLTVSSRLEKSGKAGLLKDRIVERNVVLKLLQKSEEGNTRITNKIHESILDLSFNPGVGEAMTSAFILQRIQAHNRAGQQKKVQAEQKEAEQIETEAGLGSYKGLLAQLALLYKFINSFGIAARTRGPLSVRDVLKSIMPGISHQNQDVRNAAAKILLDVQKLSGCVTPDELDSINEKARNVLLQKLKVIKIEKNLMNTEQASNPMKQRRSPRLDDSGDVTERAEVEGISVGKDESPSKVEQRLLAAKEKIVLITSKAQSKDWQEKEVALKEMEQLFKDSQTAAEEHVLLESSFLTTCLTLLKNCLDANNMTVYLQALEVANYFFQKALQSEIVLGSLPELIEPIIMRTTDTNTRVRKRSVDIIFLVWNFKGRQGTEFHGIFQKDAGDGPEKLTSESICGMIADVICDQQLGEKSIIGRLGLMIKRAQPIEGSQHLKLKSVTVFLGKNYEELTKFACQWVSHKNTKVRQNALKLITEICRINCMDPRGLPFKQRILNYILGLRANQRDPLIAKINEVCLKTVVANTSPGRAGSLEAFIDVKTLDMNQSAKSRAASMDHAGAKRRLMSASRGGNTSKPGEAHGIALPSIGNVAARETAIRSGVAQPTIVLPHSEPLTEGQRAQYAGLIELFGDQITTCFFCKSWSTRQAAIEKVQEQLYNLDPHRRDVMSGEINRQNLPIEDNFKTFLELVREGVKDPVLNNYLAVLELTQKALPTFFRYIQPGVIQNDLTKLVDEIFKKTGDMKQKIREASTNFCLYLSHQSPVGPEYMVQQVILQLDKILVERDDKDSSVAQSYGNSHMISSCLQLLTAFQVQAQILSPERETPTLMKKFMDQINAGLKHSNPQVRKEAEKLFITLFLPFGSKLEPMLVDQKPQIVTRLLQQARLETATDTQRSLQYSMIPTKKIESAENQEKQNIVRAQNQIRDQLLSQSSLVNVVDGIGEHLQTLKLPNTKKRLQAIIEIKKAVSKKIVGAQLDQNSARELFEALSMLLRQLLQDENPEVYLESLNLLKFVVGSLAPYLSSLDLHLMMGSFIGIIVQNTVSGNIRVQLSSDKVIIFFAKHQSIGPFIVAKEVTKNVDKINRAVLGAGVKRQEVLNDKKLVLLRFYGLLQLLLQQFAIVLCYQQDFYTSMLECIADSIVMATTRGQAKEEEDEVQIKQVCSQLIFNLYAIDYKLLDAAVGKLGDLNRKTPLRKLIIEHEQQQKQGKGYVDVSEGNPLNLVSQAPEGVSKDKMRDTAMSFASSTNRQSLFSPGSARTRGRSPGGMGSSQYDANWQGGFKGEEAPLHNTIEPSSTMQRRMMSLGERRAPGTNQSENYLANHPISSLTQSSWTKAPGATMLPAIDGNRNLNRTGVLLPHLAGDNSIGTGLKATYSFEAGRTHGPDSVKDHQTVQLNSKFKIKSTGGAGFSSTGQNSFGASDQQPSYEPTTARLSSGRLLSNIINNPSQEMHTNALPSQASVGIGSFIDQKTPQKPPAGPPGARQGHQASFGGDKGAVIKPPLYVPSRRGPSEGNQTVGYHAKTGFTSDMPVPVGILPSPLKRRASNESSKQ